MFYLPSLAPLNRGGGSGHWLLIDFKRVTLDNSQPVHTENLLDWW
jgi:hypothetical protein